MEWGPVQGSENEYFQTGMHCVSSGVWLIDGWHTDVPKPMMQWLISSSFDLPVSTKISNHGKQLFPLANIESYSIENLRGNLQVRPLTDEVNLHLSWNNV